MPMASQDRAAVLDSQRSWTASVPGQPAFLDSQRSWTASVPGQPAFLDSQRSWTASVPGQPAFLDSQRSSAVHNVTLITLPCFLGDFVTKYHGVR
ncbi:predicted protein [Sclerotinia sclerotiorum 1980 UF-70]|uniref:Uncharacterized protein n=1 Tax=Sclerotinia sclerotiorum (strain ATCC 18683 / 1980 / Ss-1) TaxID=665079 RepID=A7EQ59_SCLS1|nr:predicted protein [Sclerotinia sclerotiorum 1980 UF-70]EDO04975.1 predicted protein [Sclerotinia sclerotiorum 1980 UF-70]